MIFSEALASGRRAGTALSFLPEKHLRRGEENNMDFETFKENLAKDVKDEMDSRTGGSYEV
ncbi:hypothetical protein SAMN04487770_11746 [Butyrivibrio sp. ob235]|uniref:hypothetical protein n=1 Tax=Butyrivibrio sp. ob235 TaxID=1761780 RepID=UPI0008B0A627|nr:hypothetical protein [Butyrivibrio sp. ob235]SEL77717.1 hypothetical protein SAMN04487770_11746 [Butyrivibrio sp. ob235]